MLRKIIKIDEEKCNGCGLCVHACHEGAIGLVDGKAKLLHEHYCDGLGDCLPACPTNAISFEVREAPAYDEQAVLANKAAKEKGAHHMGCPGSAMRNIKREKTEMAEVSEKKSKSQLSQWPVQIKLVSPNAPYFDNAHLLIAADCTAYAYADFHKDFIKNKVTIIGCPKLDSVDYSEKLTDIIKNNNIKSVTIARMEVPCCGGLANAAIEALKNSGKMIPWAVVTISLDGEIIED